jgi:hypothetical protein
MTNELTVKGAGQGIIILDTDALDTLFTTRGYTLYQQKDGQLFESRGNQLEAVTVWKLLMNSFKDEPEFYRNLSGWMPFLQKLQTTSHSVVDYLITQCKGFDENQLSDWMNKRNDAELEELNFFGKSVASFSEKVLNDRNGFDDEDDEFDYNDEEDEY